MDTRLHGHARVLARAAWVMFVTLTLSLFIASIPAHLRQLLTVSDAPLMWLQISTAQERTLLDLGLSVQLYATTMLLMQIIVVAGFLGLSVLIFWRRSDDGMAIFVSLASILFGATSVPIGQTLAQTLPAWSIPIDLMNSIGWASGLVLFYLFPDGRFIPRWTRWAAVAVTIWALTWPFLPAINPDQWAFPLPFLIKLGWYSTGIFAQVYRYTRHSTQVERQQTKWAVFGFAAAFAGFFLFNLPVVIWADLQVSGASRLIYFLTAYPLLALLPSLFAPMSLGFACLRYRLWDIDLIINRTMIYGALTTSLVLAYGGCVIVLQWLFRRLTGQEQSDIVTAVSTLAIAAAFQPVRRSIQTLIDKSLFRRRYEVEEALAVFGSTMREDVQTDLNRLTYDLLAVVDKTVQPAHSSLWLPSYIRGKRDTASNE